MTAFPDDAPDHRLPDVVTLADDPSLQAALVAVSYADGREAEIDRALLTVIDARRMKATGILDWFRQGDDAMVGGEGGESGTAAPSGPDACGGDADLITSLFPLSSDR